MKTHSVTFDDKNKTAVIPTNSLLTEAEQKAGVDIANFAFVAEEGDEVYLSLGVE